MNKLWKKGTIPFKIAPSAQCKKAEILQAVEHFNSKTKVFFVPFCGSEEDFLEFELSHRSASFVGCKGKRQTIWISYFAPFGTIVHEMAHAIGLIHEHQRQDKPDSIVIDPMADKTNYGPEVAHEIELYDPSSITHYGENEYLQITDNSLRGIVGQRSTLSKSDVSAIDSIYSLVKCAELCNVAKYGLCNNFCDYCTSVTISNTTMSLHWCKNCAREY